MSLMNFRNAQKVVSLKYKFPDLIMACFMAADDVDRMRLKRAFGEHYDEWKMAELEAKSNERTATCSVCKKSWTSEEVREWKKDLPCIFAESNPCTGVMVITDSKTKE